MKPHSRRRLPAAVLLAAAGISVCAARAIVAQQQTVAAPPPGAPAATPAAATATADASADPRLGQLYRDVERAEALRAVKYLQVSYQQYAQYGLWSDMAALFSDRAEAVYGSDVLKGRDAIGKYFVTKYGGGKQGLPPGGLHNQILVSPVVTLSYDGRSARARWTELTMLGRFGGSAEWAGGVEENEYVLEDGRWKIARLHYHALLGGPFDTGWRTLAPIVPHVPYHYTPSVAGRPVPDQPGDFAKTPAPMTLPEIERRITALNDEDTVRNLQNIYGYYVDRKMWDDVTDLFTADGVMEIAGVGVYQGVKGIRRALERDGPAGLQVAQVHDHLQLSTTVTIEPGGNEARARGLDLGMLTPAAGEAYWTVGTFLNRYVKVNGIWQIREMRIFPKMKTDYFLGWAKSRIVDPPPDAAHAPDRPTAAEDSVADGLAIPDFVQANPATGQPVSYPPGSRVAGRQRLVAAPAAPAETAAIAPTTQAAPTAATAPTPASLNVRLAEARRRLDRSKGYDAVENVSNALGYYMDDELWQEWTDTMSKNGWRIQGSGWYIGRERLYRAMVQGHTTPPSPANPRDSIRPHLKPQPVIDVAPDAKSAKIRNRLWLYFAVPDRAGGWDSGMYPNDAAVLEDGVWRMDVNMIDQKYFSSPDYFQGWARPAAPAAGAAGRRGGGAGAGGTGAGRAGGGGRGATVFASGIEFPPDIPTAVMNSYRRKNFNSVNYPQIKPMWFHYRNPVSGRTPPNYCPDVKTCFAY